MQLSLLDFLVCLHCGGELSCLPFEKEEVSSVEPGFVHYCDSWCGAKGKPIKDSPPPVEECRLCHRQEIKAGVLFCQSCQAFYPIIGFIPEILPDSLRDEQREKEFFLAYNAALRSFPFVFSAFLKKEVKPETEERGSLSFKKAEISLTKRQDLPDGFLNPGYVLPFERLHPVRSTERILRFIVAVYHLDLRRDDLILDLGTGFAWTSEWLQKLGYRAIGVDINRDYLEIGLKRANTAAPSLLVADVENLPFKPEKFHGALFFDSFHHVEARKKCLEGLALRLKPGGRLILAEPGASHELHPHSQEVEKVYGILEKGVTLQEVEDLIKGTDFAKVVTAGERSEGGEHWSFLKTFLADKIFYYFLYPFAAIINKFLRFYLRCLLEGEKKQHGSTRLKSLDLLLLLSKTDVDELISQVEFLPLKEAQARRPFLVSLSFKRTLTLLIKKFIFFWISTGRYRKSSIAKFPYGPSEIEMLLLKKRGKREYDTRSPDFLNARFSSPQTSYRLEAGKPWKLGLTVTNSGNTTWLSSTRDGVGEVRVGGHLLTPAGRKIRENLFSQRLVRNIPPGESIDLEIDVPPVTSPGEYILEIDLLSQGIMWFKDCYPDSFLISLEII